MEEFDRHKVKQVKKALKSILRNNSNGCLKKRALRKQIIINLQSQDQNQENNNDNNKELYKSIFKQLISQLIDSKELIINEDKTLQLSRTKRKRESEEIETSIANQDHSKRSKYQEDHVEVNHLAQLEAEKQDVKKEISNIKLVFSWIPRGQTMVPEAKILDQTDTDILLLCELDKATLLKREAEKQSMLADLIAMERRTTLSTMPTGEFISVLFYNIIYNSSVL